MQQGPDLHEMSFGDCFWYYKNIVEVRQFNTFQLGNKKQIWNPDFILFSLFA